MRASCIASLAAVFLFALVSFGDSLAPPSTFRVVSANGKFVFVMLPDVPREMELRRYNEEHQQVVDAIRRIYSKSGLYKNDGSKTPFWMVDWYAFGVQIADDGVHMVRFGRSPGLQDQTRPKDPVTKEEMKQLAFSIYARDKVVRSYTIGELVDDPKMLRKSVSHFHWLLKAKMVDEKNQFVIDTYDRNHITFDLASGKIVEKKKTLPNPLIPPSRNIEPVMKWFGQVGDARAEEQCPVTPITTQADFERLWKALRGMEALPKVDFTKQFVRVWASNYSKIVEIGFTILDNEEPVDQNTHELNQGDQIKGFTYGLGVFSRDVLDVVNGKVILREPKKYTDSGPGSISIALSHRLLAPKRR